MKLVNPNRAARFFGIFVCLIFTAMFGVNFALGWPAVLSNVNHLMMSVLIPILLFTFVLVENPWVRLTEQGVEYRWFFIKRFCAWENIAQAGVMRGYGRGEAYQYPVVLLVKPPREKLKWLPFKWRNFGKVVIMPGTPDVKTFVGWFYGKLDFDDSLGRTY